MKIAEALNIIRPKGNDIISLKEAYRTLCKKYHPDINPDGLEMMKIINNAYDLLTKELGNWDCSDDRTDSDTDRPVDDILAEIIRKIKETGLNVSLEVCGTWLWISNTDKTMAATLKAVGLWWSPNKKMWYWRPAEKARKWFRGKKSMDINEIRMRHGSKAV